MSPAHLGASHIAHEFASDGGRQGVQDEGERLREYSEYR
jgi:hypothetical protein